MSEPLPGGESEETTASLQARAAWARQTGARVALLPLAQRALVSLIYGEGLTQAQAGRRLGFSRSDTSRLVSDAIQSIGSRELSGS